MGAEPLVPAYEALGRLPRNRPASEQRIVLVESNGNDLIEGVVIEAAYRRPVADVGRMGGSAPWTVNRVPLTMVSWYCHRGERGSL
jgi:hypothetical protein